MTWTLDTVLTLFSRPFIDLVIAGHHVHREHFPKGDIQHSVLLSIKTGGCPENCKYCPQSAHYKTMVQKESLMSLDAILDKARIAKENGGERFCMGAAWRSLHDKDMPPIIEAIKAVKALGLETCMALGMLSADKAKALKEAGLDYYNHNLDTSEAYYPEITSTRRYQDRLDTLAHVRASGMKVCCGGILGMGETVEDRAALIVTLANLDPHPESVPINRLVRVSGTPMAEERELDIFDFVRMIAVARITMPTARIRLSAGRESMSDEAQTLCFMAGANSIFYGETLLTTPNPSVEHDKELLRTLGLVYEDAAA